MAPNGILYQDYAKLEYGRLLWKNPASRERLLRHWTDPRHPHAERFKEWRPEVEKLLQSPKGSDEQLDAELRQRDRDLTDKITQIVFPSYEGRGYLTKDEFLTVCEWKTPRSRPRCGRSVKVSPMEDRSVSGLPEGW